MQSAKDHITQIVEEYIKLFPDEFSTFKKAMEMQRYMLKDQDHGLAEGTNSGMRVMFEMPVQLSEMLIMQLSEEEMEWFKAGGSNRKEGAYWFARKFKAFTLPTNSNL